MSSRPKRELSAELLNKPVTRFDLYLVSMKLRTELLTLRNAVAHIYVGNKSEAKAAMDKIGEIDKDLAAMLDDLIYKPEPGEIDEG